MSLALRIWLSLACALPIVIVWAIVIALVSRFRWKVSQWFLPMFAGPFLFVFIVVVIDLLNGRPFQFLEVREIWSFMLSSSLGSATGMAVAAGAILAHVAATILLSYYGLWRTQAAPAARQWSLKRLSLCLLGSLACVVLTLMLQSWIVCGIARQTIQQVAQNSKDWMPAGLGLPNAAQPSPYLVIFDEVAKSTNPAFEINFSPYRPLKDVPVRKEIEYGNKLARVHVEAIEEFLKASPFRPANNDLLTWDRREITGFKKIQNAARLATMIAIEEADHERVIRYINTMALCSDQLRVYSDADCLLESMAYAATRSALLERWLFEATPASPLVARIKPLTFNGHDFASHREAMLKQLEATMLYEQARMLVGGKPPGRDDPRMWIVTNASKSTKDPTRFLDRVLHGADNLLLSPALFEKNRHRFLVPASEFDGFGYAMNHELRSGLTRLVMYAYPTFSMTCYSLAKEDARESITSVALQIELFRQQEQKYPESLEQLVPRFLAQVPVDPFNGRPLRYLREGEDGAIVYSVGGDHVDQQVDLKYRGNRTEADIVFCLGKAYRQRRIPQSGE